VAGHFDLTPAIPISASTLEAYEVSREESCIPWWEIESRTAAAQTAAVAVLAAGVADWNGNGNALDDAANAAIFFATFVGIGGIGSAAIIAGRTLIGLEIAALAGLMGENFQISNQLMLQSPDFAKLISDAAKAYRQAYFRGSSCG